MKPVNYWQTSFSTSGMVARFFCEKPWTSNQPSPCRRCIAGQHSHCHFRLRNLHPGGAYSDVAVQIRDLLNFYPKDSFWCLWRPPRGANKTGGGHIRKISSLSALIVDRQGSRLVSVNVDINVATNHLLGGIYKYDLIVVHVVWSEG